MRAITREAIRAFCNKKKFKRDNTEIRIIEKDDYSITQMRLHGNVIAELMPSGFYISTCGWSTNTTKERLNGFTGVNIVQRDYEWYLNGEHWNGQRINVTLFCP